MFSKVADIATAELEGKYQVSSFRKVSSQATSTGTWCDLSMASGNPSPNFYSGLELTATTLDGNKGIYHGQNGIGQKILKDLSVQSTSGGAAPMTMVLCDYLLFYPQVDMDSVDPQSMDNTVTLPRYESGDGVRMFVVAQYPYIGGVNFSVTYTNQAGVTGRTTGNITMNTATTIASFIHGNTTQNGYSSFLPLQGTDT